MASSPQQENLQDEIRRAPIGDDGCYMTPTRVRMHRTLNAFMVWGIIGIVIAVACTVAAYFQGQYYADMELVATGGNTINGHSTGTLLRVAALVYIVSGILFIFLQHKGFIWFYERQSQSAPRAIAMAICVIAAIWEAYVISIGLFDILAIANIAFAVSFFMAAAKVETEERRYNLAV